jgi:hypothetical protein
MTYREQLHPWCIVCHTAEVSSQSVAPSEQVVVARFRRRNNAEDQLKRMRRLSPNCSYTIVFDPTMHRSSAAVGLTSKSGGSGQKAQVGQPITEPELT